VIALRFVEVIAVPPNKGLQRTGLNVTPLASARAAPFSPAADASR
jgi:hypothetical protein